VQQRSLTFGDGFIEKKIQLAIGRIALHLPLPEIVVAVGDSQGQPVEVRVSCAAACSISSTIFIGTK
jgi:hypothetical protein